MAPCPCFKDMTCPLTSLGTLLPSVLYVFLLLFICLFPSPSFMLEALLTGLVILCCTFTFKMKII